MFLSLGFFHFNLFEPGFYRLAFFISI